MAAAFADVLVDLLILLVATQLLGWAFQKAKQPGVIGEVVAGILVGPAIALALQSPTLEPFLGTFLSGPLVVETEILEFIAELGAIFLLFLIGIEVSLEDLLEVGPEAAAVAALGVVLPFVSGYYAGVLLGYDLVASLFLGTALVATSVGITARVLQELEVLARDFSQVILGAALIDDVLGLVTLAVVSGIASTGSADVGAVLELVLVSAAFLAAAVAAVPAIRRIDVEWLPVRTPLQFAVILGIGFSAVAAKIGLAPIVGAFFAGMVLSEIKDEHPLEEAAQGLSTFLTPIFFAVIGLRLDLAALSDPTTVLLGTALTVVAIIGKLVGGLGSIRRGFRNASVVGMGMVPRGEVGLIVAAIGLNSGAVNDAQYAVVLFVVVATTVVAPLALRPLIVWADRGNASEGDGEAATAA
jgi:Kef-type K+ transport system membrane component KefB